MNPPLPALPTDNLYKFVAISGLVLVVVGVIVPIRLQTDIERRLAPMVAGLAAATEHMVAMSRALDPRPTDGAATGLRITPMEQEAIDKTGAEADRLMKLAEDAGFSPVELRAAKRWIQVSISAGLAGVVMMGIGFGLWYGKVQKYQDQLLKAEAMAKAKAASA
jgi:hypothetical protein